MNGLTIIDPPKTGRLARFLGRDSVEAAVVEIHNTLASVPLAQLDSQSLLNRLLATGGTRAVLQPRLQAIYGEALRGLVTDGRIDDSDDVTLSTLRSLLGLSDSDVVSLHEQLVYSIYSRACAAALADGRITDDERERLDRLVEHLRIPEHIRKRIYVSHTEPIMQAAADRALADGRLSPAEEAELQALAEDLDATIRLDARTQAALERYRTLWRLSTGDIVPVDVGIALRRGEYAAGFIDAVHCEVRSVTVGRTSSGFSYTSKAVLGVRFRSGNVRSHAIKQDQMVPLDSGVLYFTSARLLFDGERKTTQIPLTKIIGANFYSDGMQVEKETGRDAWFQFDGDVEHIRAVFDGLMLRSRM